MEFSDKKIKAITDLLKEPFDPSVIDWKPQVTNKEKTSAIAIAYADTRAYIDRLNQIVGVNNWHEEYQPIVINGIPVEEGWGDKKTTVLKTKICITCKVSIDGLGTKQNVGESWADDNNAYCSAAAQAFKRACMEFGLGRYLYDLPGDQWCAYDNKKKRFSQTPKLPDWALPKPHCADCSAVITEMTDAKGNTHSREAVIANAMRHAGRQLCGDCLRAFLKAKQEAAGREVKPNGEAVPVAATQ